MASIMRDGTTLTVGCDFVDCAWAKGTQVHLKSHGTMGVSGRRAVLFTWQSTLDIETTERVLRASAKNEGAHISLFTSQAIV